MKILMCTNLSKNYDFPMAVSNSPRALEEIAEQKVNHTVEWRQTTLSITANATVKNGDGVIFSIYDIQEV